MIDATCAFQCYSRDLGSTLEILIITAARTVSFVEFRLDVQVFLVVLVVAVLAVFLVVFLANL